MINLAFKVLIQWLYFTRMHFNKFAPFGSNQSTEHARAASFLNILSKTNNCMPSWNHICLPRKTKPEYKLKVNNCVCCKLDDDDKVCRRT